MLKPKQKEPVSLREQAVQTVVFINLAIMAEGEFLPILRQFLLSAIVKIVRVGSPFEENQNIETGLVGGRVEEEGAPVVVQPKPVCAHKRLWVAGL